jgi:soluble lytic murein transglycosylase-like protein
MLGLVRLLRPLPVLGLLLLPAVAGASSACAYWDADGVLHVSNASADPRCRKKVKLDAGLYRAPAAAGRGANGGAGAERNPLAGRGPRRVSDPALREHIREAAVRYSLPEALIEAVMAVESNFNPTAVSHKGAAGLMQLMPMTAKEMFVVDLWNPRENIQGGARYLRVLANQYEGDLTKTLAAYNAGPDAVRRAGEKIPDIPETREYVRRVLGHYERLKARGDEG